MADTIHYHYNRAHALAMKEVVRLARAAMAKDPRLTQFYMAMGLWGFEMRDGSTVWRRPRSVRAVERFIDKWDDVLKLTGDPM
jgi:hypothetical protein